MDAQLRRYLTWCENQNVLDADAVRAGWDTVERYVSEQREPGTAVPKLQFDHVCGSTVCDNPADCRLCKNTLIKRCGTAHVKKNFKNRYRGTETILPYCKASIICRPVADAQMGAPPFECVSHIRIYLINDEKYKAAFEQDHTRFPTWANLQPLIIKDRPAGSRQTLFKDTNNIFLTRAVERTNPDPHDFTAVISGSDGNSMVVPLPSQTAFNSKEKGYRLIGVACQHRNPGAAASADGALELEEMNDILPAISEPFRVGTAGRPDKPLSESDVIEDIRGLDKACIALRNVDEVIKKALVQRFRLVRRLEKNEALGVQDEAGLHDKHARFKAALLRAIHPSTTIGTVRDFREFARLVDGDPDLKGQVSLALGLTDDGWNKVAVPHANTAMPLDSDDRMYRTAIPNTACFFRLLYHAVNGAPAFSQGPHSFEMELQDSDHQHGALLFTEPASNLHWHAVVQHYTRLAEADWRVQASASSPAHPNWEVVTSDLKAIPVPEETCQEWRKHMLQQLQAQQWQQQAQQLCLAGPEHEREQQELLLARQVQQEQQLAWEAQQRERERERRHQEQQPVLHAQQHSMALLLHRNPNSGTPPPVLFSDPPAAIILSLDALEAGEHQQHLQQHQGQHQQLFHEPWPSNAPPPDAATRPNQAESLLNNSSFLKPGNLPLEAPLPPPQGDVESRSLPIDELDFKVSDESMKILTATNGPAAPSRPASGPASAPAPGAAGQAPGAAAAAPGVPVDGLQGQNQRPLPAAAELRAAKGQAPPSAPVAEPRKITGQVRSSHSLRLPGTCSVEPCTKRATTRAQPHQQQQAEAHPQHALPHPQPPPLPLFAPPPPYDQQRPLLSPFCSAHAPTGALVAFQHPSDQTPNRIPPQALGEQPAHTALPNHPHGGPPGQHPTYHSTQATCADGTPAASAGSDGEQESASTALDSMQDICVDLPPVGHGEAKALVPAFKAQRAVQRAL